MIFADDACSNDEMARQIADEMPTYTTNADRERALSNMAGVLDTAHRQTATLVSEAPLSMEAEFRRDVVRSFAGLSASATAVVQAARTGNMPEVNNALARFRAAQGRLNRYAEKYRLDQCRL